MVNHNIGLQYSYYLIWGLLKFINLTYYWLILIQRNTLLDKISSRCNILRLYNYGSSVLKNAFCILQNKVGKKLPVKTWWDNWRTWESFMVKMANFMYYLGLWKWEKKICGYIDWTCEKWKWGQFSIYLILA